MIVNVKMQKENFLLVKAWRNQQLLNKISVEEVKLIDMRAPTDAFIHAAERNNVFL